MEIRAKLNGKFNLIRVNSPQLAAKGPFLIGALLRGSSLIQPPWIFSQPLPRLRTGQARGLHIILSTFLRRKAAHLTITPGWPH
jgi:hypothetical protein